MRTTIYTFAMLLVMACSNNSGDSEIIFETVASDKTVILSNDEDSPSCRVHLKLESATSEAGHRGELINETIIKTLLDPHGEKDMKIAAEKFITDYTDNYKKTMLPLYNQDRIDTTKRFWYEYHYILEATTQKGTKNTICYLTTIDYYEGGAHGVNLLKTMNFDTRDGHLLTLDNIFVPGYEQPLKELLMNALKTKTGCSTIKALHEKGYLRSMDIFPSKNFILDNETITFIYNPSEIASYDLGSTQLVIPYSDLSSLTKNSFDL
ncbi:MAG: DUF3298 domain-containing protein [Prevotella sp.]|nr:DUF3298 domain-containing protein [Prevotella sp.]